MGGMRQWRRFVGWGAGQAAAILALLWWVLGLGTADLTVPFNYWGDTLWFLVPIKSLIENGNPYSVPQLSAPFELSAAAFPSMTNLDWAVMKLMSPVAKGSGHLLNLFWIATIVATGWLAAFSLRLLGVRRGWLCVIMGVAYALLPYAFMRNVAHISLVYYAVAPICVLAAQLAMGLPSGIDRAVMFVSSAALVAQGFGYVYNSFFTVLLLGFAAISGYLKTRQRGSLKVGAYAIILVLSTASLNLVPSFWSWASFGKPADIGYKSASEAEIYGLKLRRMLTPHEANALPLLSSWGKSDARANFPNENENVTARLGTLGALGLILLIARILIPESFRGRAPPSVFDALATLTLFCLLVTTVGGLGAIFNQLIPDFRAYNRFSVFIAFLSIAGLAIWIETLLDSARSRRWHSALALVVAAVFAVSIYDQTLDARPLVNRRTSDEAAAHFERAFVGALEKILPAGSAMFQLPVTEFPSDGGRLHMLTYDHARAYLASSTLRWSWPSFSKRHRAWQASLDGLDGDELATRLVLSRFRAVWIDRNGYEDRGQSMVDGLQRSGAIELLAGESQRYVVMDLAGVEKKLRNKWSESEFRRRQTAVLSQPGVAWKRGFYAVEVMPSGIPIRWSRKESHLKLINWLDSPRSTRLAFEIVAGRSGQVTVSGDGVPTTVVDVGVEPTSVHLPITIPPNGKLDVVLNSNVGRVALPPGETRDLHFQLRAIKIE